MDGCFKMLMVSSVIGFIGVIFLGVVGGVVYMNREKMGIPPMEEWSEHMEAAMNGESDASGEAGGTGAQASSGGGSAGSEGQAYTARRPVVSRAPMHVNKASYNRVSSRSDVLVLVDYYADWCGPCRKLAPDLERLVQKHGDKVVVLKVDVEKEKDLARQAGVRSIPDVRILHGGKEVDKFIGSQPYAKIEKLILKHESLLPPPKKLPVINPAGGEGSIDPVTKKYLPPGISRK